MLMVQLWVSMIQCSLINLLFWFLQDKNLVEVKQILKETQLEDNRKRELSTALHAYFKDWLYGNIYGALPPPNIFLFIFNL